MRLHCGRTYLQKACCQATKTSNSRFAVGTVTGGFVGWRQATQLRVETLDCLQALSQQAKPVGNQHTGKTALAVLRQAVTECC